MNTDATLEFLMQGPVIGPIEDDSVLRQHLQGFGMSNFICDVQAPFSPWNARCQDQQGQWWYVKAVRTDQLYKHGEVQSLQHLQSTNLVPVVQKFTSCGLLLGVRAVAGQTMANMQLMEKQSQEQLIAVGRAMSRLHQAEIPKDTVALRDMLPTRYNPTPNGRPGQLKDIAQGYLITQKLYEQYPTDPIVYLHGDLNPRNIIDDQGRIWMIDPYGVCGPAVFELCRLASYYPDPLLALSYLAQGYGQRFSSDQWALPMAWSCIMVNEELVTLGQWTANHQALVDAQLDDINVVG